MKPPGADLVEQGVRDLVGGIESVEAMLVAGAGERLRAAGVDVPYANLEHPSHRLYELLAERHGDDAHGRYTALRRRLVSYASAVEHAAQR